ncbi:C-terminal processing peptidase-1. Serine peptidase. MEROPS family S41A [Lishizhenia tianjinensis]|uniref:C-terminal processing peptidase-1. Serine peptidase. MEROPS family S41A n=1 Tax=Lishizhenia tianjinensis TaxID=477690 RepID=A0A1I7BR38_9FLAO|nr:carboxy terminal-processing peptidase [Lishizhenia tianjinensis]SFT89654.1 C-terminal processing peptidase-1. Serine peptidase. MEROPS family S41A [Lishizhenia tianjinensis]
MKFLYCLLLGISSCVTWGQDTLTDSFCSTFEGLEETLKKYHYQVPTQDSVFHQNMIHYFLDEIDPNGQILTLEDEQKITTSLSNTPREMCKQMEDVKEIYKASLQRLDHYFKNFEQEEFQLKNTEIYTYSFTPSRLTLEEHQKLWKKKIRLKAYAKHLQNFDEKDSVQPLTQDKFQAYIKTVLVTENCKLKTYENEIEHMGESLMNAYAMSFDPHSNYFSGSSLMNFEEQLSDEKLSYGIEFNKNRAQEIVIASIAPGSSAWKSNQLHEGDILIKTKHLGTSTENFECSSLESLIDLLQGYAPSAKTSFTFKKSNGEIVEVELEKSEIQVSDNIISSYILDGEQKVGYIYLPSFYTNDDFYFLPNGCANDLAKELLQLKREGIEGLVLDLRDNGGGSLLEAIRLVGSFINYGGITVIDERGEERYTLKDPSRGYVFEKPLVVMINQFSASASELFASAMQDQNRGVVVGSPSYGKSTMQHVLPLERSGEYLANHFVKVTTGAFYRIDGQTHQNKGVQPDITFPLPYQGLPISEKNNVNALQFDTISKKTYYYPLSPIILDKIQELSKNRIEQDSNFLEVQNFNQKLIKQFTGSQISCKYEDFVEYYYSNNRLESDTSKMAFKADRPNYFKDNLYTAKADEIIANSLEGIKDDIYLNEAYQILIDLINQTQNK